MNKQKKKFSMWNILWILPLALAVIMYLIPAFESADKTPVEGSSSWMKALPDEMPLSQAVIPGTHDSATESCRLAFFSKCQGLSIKEQLEAGYRYLDIRLGDGEGLPLMHGFVNCTVSGWPWAGKLYLESVLKDCYAFLDENPTETILFCVKHEHGDADLAEFIGELASYVGQKQDKWYAGDSIPTVGEARGKIVLLKRFSDPGQKLPGVVFSWKDQKGYEDVTLNSVQTNNPNCTLFVQDRFEYDADEKWTAFTAGMAAGETDGANVSLNFLSTKGHAKYGHPYRFASALNKKLLNTQSSELNGWIIVDFASAKIAKQIYSANFD